MDANLIFMKTLIGDEAVRQSTRVVQRNLRMVLVQVDGNLSVGELSTKIGSSRLVESALRELEEGGFIVARQGATMGRSNGSESRPTGDGTIPPPISQFSTFGERAQLAPEPPSINSQFSSFGKPILPAASYQNPPSSVSVKKKERKSTQPELSEEIRPLALGRWLLGVPLALLLAVLLLGLLFPYSKFKPDLEVAASHFLQAPVRIGTVSFSLLPRPALLLSDVRLGDSEEGAIAQVRIASPHLLLGSGTHTLPGVDVINSTISADFLASSALFKQPIQAAQGKLRIQQLNFEQLSIGVRDLALRNLSGQIHFTADGSVDKAALGNDELGLRLQMMPTPEGLVLDIQGSGWKPFGVTPGFNSLQATGLLQKGKLLIRNLDTVFLNGILKGNWLLDWSKGGLSMVGDASLLRMDCRQVSAALVPALRLEGELSGNLRLRASGTNWESLWGNVEATLDADIAHGVLHGVDLGEVVRGGSGFVMRSGATRFERLRTALSINPRQVIGRDVLMAAGMMSVSGQFSAGREKPVDANLVVSMHTSVSTVRAPVHVTGELPNLMAVSGK